MSTSYFPSNDSAFSSWADTFIAYLEPNVARFGLAIPDLVPLVDVHPLWDTILGEHFTAQATAKSMTSQKNVTRDTFEEVIRSLVNRINAYPGTTDADREALGIKSAQPVQTTGMDTIPDTPIALIDVGGRLKHVLRVQNSTGQGVSRSKPAGALGCEVWRKVGDAPQPGEELQYVGLVTRNPFPIEYTSVDGGKQVHYMLRWVNSKGVYSSWSETESATIAA